MSDESNTPRPPACTRAIARQGTSYMAFRREPLDPDDPLLGFRPVPSKDKKPRHSAITPARQRAFILALAECGIVTQAARQIGASTEALYRLRHKAGGEEFSAAWDAAIDRGLQRLEDTALARAMQGEERMVVSGGEVLGFERRHNENLVMFFLRNRRADRYGSDWRQIKRGHPLYEMIRDEVLAELRANAPDIEDIRAEILAKVAAMERARERERQIETKSIEPWDEDGQASA
jgi:hypothetical protein